MWRAFHRMKGIMKDRLDNENKKNEIMEKCFKCLVENGLEKTTTRILSSYTGLTSSSLYYWFAGKDRLVLESTRYGLDQIIEEMFTVVYTYLSDLSSIFDKVIECARLHRNELRFIFQVATSPLYGEELRELAITVPEAIDSFSIVLAERLNCNQEQLRRIVHLTISVILNDIVWEKSCESQIQYEVLYQMLIDMQR